MRMTKLVGRRIKEDPKDAKTVSHKFLVRGGYVRPVSAGIYSLLPVGKRVIAKIEAIVRAEMNAVDGQEVLMPVVLPADLWQESGRYESVGAELLRFKDRNGKPMLLGMTHEEAVVQLARTELTSYKQLPVMLYQIQTKYRDEARPRAGLIRVREFTMKDAYSFHTSQADLEAYYMRVHEAYVRIFRRLGMNNVLSIEANSGMMGGAVSHEFMALCDCGEDTIFYSPDRRYRANREVAHAAWHFEKPAQQLPLEKIHTPGTKTIEAVAGLLNVTAAETGKVVFYQNAFSGELICALIRGDFEVNESKLANAALAPELKFADDEAIRKAGCVPGFASPLGIDPARMKVVVDRSVAESGNLVVGANEADYHYKNFNFERDCAANQALVADIATVREGDPCPLTGEPLKMERGIEVGNIFQLGTKYTAPMGCNYLDENGKSNPMIMGCYGIGIGRAMASVIEQSHDDYGPIWPISIAPYQVELVAIGYDKPEVRAAADGLYDELNRAGVEVLFDDRGEKPGFMFSDADLLGIPFRVVVSPKTLADHAVEYRRRDCRDAERVALAAAVETVRRAVAAEQARFE